MGPAANPVLLVAALLAAMAAGVMLTLALRGGRRRGDTPHCRRCDYIITGNQSGRCPECGAELTAQAIVLGERQRRPRLVLLAVVLLAIALAALVFLGLPALGQVNWYSHKPPCGAAHTRATS